VFLKCGVCKSRAAEQNANGGGGVRRRKVGGQSDGSQQAGAQSVDDRRGPGLVGKTTDGSAVAAVARVADNQHLISRCFISYISIINNQSIKHNGLLARQL